MQRLRLTNKEKDAVSTIVSEGLGRGSYELLDLLNFEGGYNFEEKYTIEELYRILEWIHKKLSIEE